RRGIVSFDRRLKSVGFTEKITLFSSAIFPVARKPANRAPEQSTLFLFAAGDRSTGIQATAKLMHQAKIAPLQFCSDGCRIEAQPTSVFAPGKDSFVSQ